MVVEENKEGKSRQKSEMIKKSQSGCERVREEEAAALLAT